MSQIDQKNSKKPKPMKENNSQTQVINEEIKTEDDKIERKNEIYNLKNNGEKKENINKNPQDEEKAVNQCLVCIEEIKEECVLNPCQHRYCYECIVDWMKQKQRCPLCNNEVIELIRSDETAEAGSLITKVADIADSAAIEKIKSSSESEGEVVERFECLDHNYLKNEVDKLLYKLEFVQKKMEQNSNKYDDFNWFVIESIDDQIYELENIVEEFRDFNPSEIATRCFQLEEHLDVIRNNKWEMIEEAYSDLYAIQLQQEEEEIVNSHNHSSKKNGNQNNNSKKSGNANSKTNQKGNSKTQICDYEDEYYNNDEDLSNIHGCFKDHSIKNFKPKAPKKKFNTTVPSNLATTTAKI